ncbi:hypothetical protein WME76_08390 [Sorangium sp. So ce119]
MSTWRGRRIAFSSARGRGDEGDASPLARFRELTVFREERVLGVDVLGPGAPGDVEDAIDAEVALARRCGADGVRLVREADMEAAAVHVDVDGDALDAGLMQRPEHSEGDLAAVGDEDLADQEPALSPESACARGAVAERPRAEPRSGPDRGLP